MGHHQGGDAALGQVAQGVAQGHFAVRVQVGVRFVQYYQRRIAVQGAGQGHALALPGGQVGAARGDGRFVVLRQAHDHVVATGLLRRGEHRIVIRFGQTGDVLGHGALEQFHLLGQVAHVAETALGRPVADGRAVQAHHPALGRPDAHHQAGQGALAAAAGADEPGGRTRL